MLARRMLLASLLTLSITTGCRKRVQTPDPNGMTEEGPPQEPPRPVRGAAPQR